MKAGIKTKIIGGGAAAAVVLGGGLASGAVWHEEQVTDAHDRGFDAGLAMGARLHTVSGPKATADCNVEVDSNGISLNDSPVRHGSSVRFVIANGYCTDDEVDRWIRAVTIETEHRPTVDRVRCNQGICTRSGLDK